MTTARSTFRRLLWILTPVATIAALIWLAVTPLEPFYGFVLIPALTLTLVAAGAWLDGKLETAHPSSLALKRGDVETLTTRLAGLNSPRSHAA